jgi:hypothetical protein
MQIRTNGSATRSMDQSDPWAKVSAEEESLLERARKLVSGTLSPSSQAPSVQTLRHREFDPPYTPTKDVATSSNSSKFSHSSYLPVVVVQNPSGASPDRRTWGESTADRLGASHASNTSEATNSLAIALRALVDENSRLLSELREAKKRAESPEREADDTGDDRAPLEKHVDDDLDQVRGHHDRAPLEKHVDDEAVVTFAPEEAREVRSHSPTQETPHEPHRADEDEMGSSDPIKAPPPQGQSGWWRAADAPETGGGSGYRFASAPIYSSARSTKRTLVSEDPIAGGATVPLRAYRTAMRRAEAMYFALTSSSNHTEATRSVRGAVRRDKWLFEQESKKEALRVSVRSRMYGSEYAVPNAGRPAVFVRATPVDLALEAASRPLSSAVGLGEDWPDGWGRGHVTEREGGADVAVAAFERRSDKPLPKRLDQLYSGEGVASSYAEANASIARGFGSMENPEWAVDDLWEADTEDLSRRVSNERRARVSLSQERDGMKQLLHEVADAVGARSYGEILPRVRAAVAGALALPALDAFAAHVCGMVSSMPEHVRGGGEDYDDDSNCPTVGLRETLVRLGETLAELRARRGKRSFLVK